jgi:hypothetical protein
MVRSIGCGLPLSSWEILTVGQIIDYIMEYIAVSERDQSDTTDASQADFDAFG